MRELLMRIPGPRYLGIFFAACVMFCCGSHVTAQTLQNPAPVGQAATAPPVDESTLADSQKSATEVNKELSNPISSIWALQIQENTFFIHVKLNNIAEVKAAGANVFVSGSGIFGQGDYAKIMDEMRHRIAHSP